MIRDVLNLTAVQVARETLSTDGMGGTSATTTLTTLSRSAIWQNGGNTALLSDKLAKTSSHVLALETGTYAWADTDRYVVYGSNTYEIIGRADDILNKSELTVVGLELIT